MKHKKPYPKHKPRSPYRPKWQVAQEEHEYCDAIRRNIRRDTGLLRQHEHEIGAAQEKARRAGDAVAELQRQIADLRQALRDNSLPQLPGPAGPRLPGRLGWILRRLGIALDLTLGLSAARNREAILDGIRDLENQVRERERDADEARREMAAAQARLDDRAKWVERDFEAFQAHRCHGDPENSVTYTLSSLTRRRLSS